MLQIQFDKFWPYRNSLKNTKGFHRELFHGNFLKLSDHAFSRTNNFFILLRNTLDSKLS